MNSTIKKDVAINNPQVIYSWSAPYRPYKKKSNGVLHFYIALALLLCVIVILFGDWILTLPIVAAVFLFYALTITPPGNGEFKITQFGIESSGITYQWGSLSSFYILQKFDYFVVVVVGTIPFINRLHLVCPNKATVEKVVDILADHIVFVEKPQLTISDKIGQMFSYLLPNEESFTPTIPKSHEEDVEEPQQPPSSFPTEEPPHQS